MSIKFWLEQGEDEYGNETWTSASEIDGEIDEYTTKSFHEALGDLVDKIQNRY